MWSLWHVNTLPCLTPGAPIMEECTPHTHTHPHALPHTCTQGTGYIHCASNNAVEKTDRAWYWCLAHLCSLFHTCPGPNETGWRNCSRKSAPHRHQRAKESGLHSLHLKALDQLLWKCGCENNFIYFYLCVFLMSIYSVLLLPWRFIR